MSEEYINDIIEKLHQIDGFPRLEIEGCKYPINEELIANYRKSRIPIPQRKGSFVVVPIIPREGDKDKKGGSNGLWWIKHDGFGGQVGSVNVKSEYLDHLDTEEGDKCAYVIRDIFDREDYYHTEINCEYILLRKSDLISVVEGALSSTNRTNLRNIRGKRVIDEVIWDDSIPSGPGLKVTDVSIRLGIDLTQEEPKYKIDYSSD